jgi:hypothetical protein
MEASVPGNTGLLAHFKRPKILEASSAAANQTLRKSEVLRAEPYIGKQPVIEMGDAPTKAAARRPTHP